MTSIRFLLFVLAGVLVVSNGCTPSESTQHSLDTAAGASISFQDIVSPAGPGSSTPTLHTTNEGVVLLSWVEPHTEGGHVLRFSQLEQDGWSEPITIVQGEDWFVNWADFPSLISLDDGTLAAHYLVKSAKATYAYDVHVTQSLDGGQTWSPSVIPHTDGTQTEHGFVSMLPSSDGRLFAAWLDGRNTGGGHDGHGSQGAMTLRTAILDHAGTLYGETLLDERICECCQTSAARTSNGIVVAYRDRSDEEIRDISVVRWQNGTWSVPQTVHEDGWQIRGCPVNGPAVAAAGEQVVIAWFTAARDTLRIKLSFSTDEGRSFGAPVQIDDGLPLGRLDTILLQDRSALVSWIEKTDGGAEIRVRRVYPDGSPDASSVVAVTSASRASGFPRMARSGNAVYISWTEAGELSSVHTAAATFSGGS
ncbi:MAG: sialidase family protein [Bacteroidota bacterium]|nr:sialidase family protein [Bacteroidota bacterium]MDE2644321.1 sialidase family protein [Bacteroidota bacterium]MXW14083.1 exo-alpha-sialidase [Rhodothermaceae bacterium]MYC04210.1 exo-alpha-sialidase [Rhodothermaceae bacterium]MYI16125.1 exo-alpha-sialidase [Rhodothermaceae bacterium]